MAKKKSKRPPQEVPKHPLPVQISPKIDYHRPLSSQYVLPAHFLRKCPKLQQTFVMYSNITLSDVHEDVGHTFVRFLYSGDYETLNSPLDESTADIAREYKRSVLVYQASRMYSLPDLEVLAKQKIEQLGEEVSILYILQTTRDVFSSLPDGKTWLPSYIKRNLQRILKPGRSAINHHFDNTVMKMMLEMLTKQRGDAEFFLLNECLEIIGNVRNHVEETAVEETAVEETAVEETAVEETAVEETAVEETAVEETAVEETAVEETAVGEPAVEEPAVEKPAVKGWPSALLSFDNPPHAELPDATTPSAEALTKTQPVRNHIVRVSVADIDLYRDWESLSSRRKAKRASKLVTKDLLVPSKDGFISIFVA
ncbi:uncharacterized protein BJX67DRAFT_388823 [Aspergillus lucknowensis]|uniref:BTB domain-containing protein n=1 Tax=Aspergillus lucknowensis TaxID=176173 RepID=A0ABR4LNY4_9EURO